jgi:hypothetical protein
MIIKIPIGKWFDLSTLVEQQFKTGWIYRGERKRITASDHASAEKAPGEMFTASIFPMTLAKSDGYFSSSSAKRTPNSNGNQRQLEQLEWMILGQHHRLPTRLKRILYKG